MHKTGRWPPRLATERHIAKPIGSGLQSRLAVLGAFDERGIQAERR
jgi:hypothetical protein